MDVRGLLHREDGQTMAEYSVILAVLITGIIAALSLMGVAIAGRFLTFLGYLAG
jgi:Flp pilus assembly pilin Flp